jgi:2-keto-4-pentenoate hydratase
MDQTIIDKAAEILRSSEETGTTCAPIRELIGDTDVASAYKIQEMNTKIKLAQGRRIVGSKIGLTSFSVQEQLGVDQPDYGMLFADTEVKHDGSISVKELMQPKAEAEIALVLKADLSSEILTTEIVEQAVDYAVAAIEIVGSRIEGWNIRITDTISDNASASHFVLSTEKKPLRDIDLLNCKMQMTQNGAIVSEGIGKACMGSPLNAALWLAQTMRELETPLKAGDVLLTGALGPMVDVAASETFEANIEGLGNVVVAFTE